MFKEAIQLAIRRATEPVVVVLSHLIIAAIMLLSIYCLERILQLALGQRSPILFDTFPISWLFQSMYVVVLTTFVVYGLREAYRSLYRPGRNNERSRKTKTIYQINSKE